MQDIRLLVALPVLVALLLVSHPGGPAAADCGLIPPGSDRACTNGVPDLTGLDFTQCDSEGTDFRGRDLTDTSFYFAILDGIDGSLGECTAAGVFDTPTRFAGADLRNVRMQSAQLAGADFSDGARLDSAHLTLSDFAGASFAWDGEPAVSGLAGARLWGASFDAADLSSTNDASRVDVRSVVAICVEDTSNGETVCPSFDETDFTRADLRRSFFQNARMVDTVFARADLRDALIEGLTSNTTEWHPCCVKLPGSLECELDASNLPVLADPKVGPCIDFSDAQMQGIVMQRTDFAQFWNTDNAVDLSDANLFESGFLDLDMTNLLAVERVNLQNADLAGADFSGAADTDGRACGDPVDVDCMPMSGANLQGAKLSTIDSADPPHVSVARFDAVDLSGALLSTNANPDDGGLVAPCQTWTETVDDVPTEMTDCVSFEGSTLRAAVMRGVDFVELEGFDFATSLLKDLSGADLQNATLSSESKPADLADYVMSRADLSGAELSYATLDDTDLSDANLAGATLARTAFGSSGAPALLWGASLAAATMCVEDSSTPPVAQCADFQYAEFFEPVVGQDRVSLRDVDFTLAPDLLGIQSFELLDLSGAILRGKDLSVISSFDRSVLSGADLAGADFGAADLGGADLSGALLAGGSVSGSTFAGADLSGASLAGAKLSDVALCAADGSQCVSFASDQSFEAVRMRRVDLAVYAEDTWAGRCFAGADLASASLTAVGGSLGFTGLDLTGTSFAPSGGAPANLAGADLEAATLHGVVFDGADMAGASLSGADYCPDAPPGTPLLDPCESPPSTALPVCARFAGTRLRRANMFGFAIAEYPPADQAGFFQQLAKTGSGPNQRADLLQLDLTLADLFVAGGIDLANADLDQAKLTGADLSGADLAGARLGRVAGGCVVDSAGVQGVVDAERCTRLPNARLEGAHLLGASLSDSDLSGADFIGAGSAAAAVLDGADLSGASLLGAVLGGSSVPSASMVAADLTRTTFCTVGDTGSCAQLEGVRLRDAVLAEQDFGLFGDPDFFATLATLDDGDGQQRIDLGAVDLRLSLLPGMTLTSARSAPGEDVWMGALLERSVLDGGDLAGADLRYARMSRTSGQCVNDADGFQGEAGAIVCTRLSGAKLNGADLSRSLLLGADLSDAELGADLTGEDEETGGPITRKANLSDADLSGANLTGVDLFYAILDRGVYGSADFARDASIDSMGFCVGLLDAEKADLRGATLLGSDFSSAVHFNEGCILVDDWTRYDENTLLPVDFSESLKSQMRFVPEPGVLVSQLAVLFGLGALRRRRRTALRSSSRSASGPAR